MQDNEKFRAIVRMEILNITKGIAQKDTSANVKKVNSPDAS
jgi:hypothetical protein